MTAEEIKVYLAIAGSIISIAVSVIVFFKHWRDGVKSGKEAAVKDALQQKKVSDLETAQQNMKAELDGVKTGLELGIGKLHDSLAGIGDLLNGLQTKVAILIDRDEREERANLAAQQAAQFNAQRPTRTTKPRA